MADTPIYPVTGWNIGPIKKHDAVAMQLQFLEVDDAGREKEHQGRIYALTGPQARELAQRLLAALDELRSDGSESFSG